MSKKYSPLPQQDVNLNREFFDISTAINDLVDEVDSSVNAMAFPWVYQSGYYYRGRCAAIDTTLNLGSGNMRGCFFIVSKTTTFDRISCEITTPLVGGEVRLGVYNTTNGVPSNLVLDAGTVVTDAAATAEIVIDLTLTPGAYYVCGVKQHANSAVLRASVITNITFLYPMPGTYTCWQASGITGALPETTTWVPASSSSVHQVMLRAA